MPRHTTRSISPKRGASVVARVVAYNAGREPQRLAMKYAAMARDPFAFFRGTDHLFYEDWAADPGCVNGPLVWTCGDLHLENFGSYRGENRLAYFDMNDFDEALLAPATWELARFVCSLFIAGVSLSLGREDAADLARESLAAYQLALRDGKPRWVERATAVGMVRDLLRSVKGRTQAALLAARTTGNAAGRRLRIDGRKALPVSAIEKRRVHASLAAFASSQSDPRFYDVIDVARRVAGTGSLGIPRYVVLVQGRGGADGNVLLDLKAAKPSSLLPYISHPQPAWPTEAHRVVAVQSRMQAISPALLRPLPVGPDPFVLRELQPSEDRLALGHWRGKLSRLRKVVRTMGRITAWDQLRSGGRDGSATIDDLVAFASSPGWTRELIRYGRRYSRTVAGDWKNFVAARERGELGPAPVAEAAPGDGTLS